MSHTPPTGTLIGEARSNSPFRWRSPPGGALVRGFCDEEATVWVKLGNFTEGAPNFERGPIAANDPLLDDGLWLEDAWLEVTTATTATVVIGWSSTP